MCCFPNENDGVLAKMAFLRGIFSFDEVLHLEPHKLLKKKADGNAKLSFAIEICHGNKAELS